MTFKKITGKFHLWLGLASGLNVFIISITGCLYAFIDEIKPVVYKDRLFVEVPVNAQRLPLSVLKGSAQKALGESYTIQNAGVPAQSNATVWFRSRKFNEDALLYSDYMEYYFRVFVNPYTAEVVKVENTKWEFFNLIVNLHINLLLGHTGGQIIGWSVVIFVITLITGLVIWWPKNRKTAKKRIWFRWKETTKWKRKNYDLHNIPGFYILIIALVIALTGLVWAFKWFDNSVQWVANGGKTYDKVRSVYSDTTATLQVNGIDNGFEDAMQRFPDANFYYLIFPKKTSSTFNISADYDDSFKSASARYDQHTGKLLEASAFTDKNNGEKIRALNYDIHTGAILDLPGKILAFIASLLSASLPVTGFLIWLGKNKKEQKQKQAIPMKQLT